MKLEALKLKMEATFIHSDKTHFLNWLNSFLIFEILKMMKNRRI